MKSLPASDASFSFVDDAKPRDRAADSRRRPKARFMAFKSAKGAREEATGGAIRSEEIAFW